MRNNECVLHPRHPQDLVCTYDTCEHKLICEECAKVHHEIHDEGYIYPFAKLVEIHSNNKFTELKKELVTEKDSLERALRDKLDSTGPSGRLEAKVKESEEGIGEAVQEYIRYRTKDVKGIIQQYEGNLQKTELRHPEKMIPKIVKELMSEASLIDECRRDTRTKLRSLHEWVERALDEIELFNYEVDIIIETIDRRKEEILRRLGNDFKNSEASHHVNLDITVNQMVLDRNDSFEQKYTKMKRVGWENQRLSVEIDKLNKRMVAKDRKVEHYEKEIQDLLARIKSLQIELDRQTKKFVELERSRELEKLREQELMKDERRSLQELLVQKGVDMMGEVKEINLRKKGITHDELKLISKNFPAIVHLDLSENRLDEPDLETVFAFSKLRVLSLNYLRLSAKFVEQIPRRLPELTRLSLDSNGVTDDSVAELCNLRLVALSLVDNRITDTGAIAIANRLEFIEELHLSYNQLTSKSVESISKYLYKLRVLHLARNRVRNKGAGEIAKGLKDLEELFLGGCEISKEGCLPIARNNNKLRRLSLGKNELSTDAIFELIMYLSDLEWLDISFCALTDLDIDRIRKLCVANEKLEIVIQQS